MSEPPFIVAEVSRNGIQRLEGEIRDLNAVSETPDHDWLVIGPEASVVEQLSVDDFSHRQQGSIIVYPFLDADEMTEDWSTLPEVIAARLRAPETHAVVAISREALIRTGANGAPFGDGPEPVWEWLIRRADAGNDIVLGRSLTHSSASRARSSRPALVPAAVQPDRRWLMPHLSKQGLISQSRSAADAVAVLAGLLQIHGFLEESHQQSQSVQGAGRHRSADYWHGVMHRREPDYGNAKYWFRRVGRHPVFPSLAAQAQEILGRCKSPESQRWQTKLATPAGWDAEAFIDLCAACGDDEEAPLSLAVREIQWQEMRLLMHQSYRDAMAA